MKLSESLENLFFYFGFSSRITRKLARRTFSHTRSNKKTTGHVGFLSKLLLSLRHLKLRSSKTVSFLKLNGPFKISASIRKDGL